MNEMNLKRAPYATDATAGHAKGGAGAVERAVMHADIAEGDWDCLFAAVIERLTATLGYMAAVEQRTDAAFMLLTVRTSVSECVVALNQILMSIRCERSQHGQLIAEIEHMRVQLARAHAEANPASTQARDMRTRRLALHDGLIDASHGCGTAGDEACTQCS
jgi:hypothetical protein